MKNSQNTIYQIERRFRAYRTLLAALIALIFCFGLIATSSDSLGKDIWTFVSAPLSTFNRFCTFLIKLSPLLFTSCSVCILFAVGSYNFATEGAFFIGAVAASALGILEGIPPFIHFIMMFSAGAAAGAAVITIPPLLEAKFGANVVVSSLMLNYICTYLGYYFIRGPLRDPAASHEATYIIQAKLPYFINTGGSRVHCGVLIGLAVIILIYLVINKTTFGYRTRTVGCNPSFAKFSGIGVSSTIITASIVAGLVAGLGGGVEVSGYYTRLKWSTSPGYGWDGIMIATIAGSNPLLAIAGSSFLAYLRTSSDILNIKSTIPVEIVDIAQSVVIVMIAAKGILRKAEDKAIIKFTQNRMDKGKKP